MPYLRAKEASLVESRTSFRQQIAKRQERTALTVNGVIWGSRARCWAIDQNACCQKLYVPQALNEKPQPVSRLGSIEPLACIAEGPAGLLRT